MYNSQIVDTLRLPWLLSNQTGSVSFYTSYQESANMYAAHALFSLNQSVYE